MKAKRAVVTAGGALALTAVVVTLVLLRPSNGEQTAPAPPATTPASRETAPTTTTTIYRPSQTYVGQIWLRLATDVPGPQSVRLVWGPNVRRFAVDGGTPVTYCFLKRDAIVADIVVSSTVAVDVSLGDGCPPEGVDANWGWSG